jgi:hypothetical protein
VLVLERFAGTRKEIVLFMLSQRLGEYGRIIGVTVVVTTLYLLLQQAWLVVPDLVSITTFLERPSAAELEKEAEDVAKASQLGLQSAPASSRHDIWQLGFYLGYLSHFLGSYAMSAENVQDKVRRLAEPILAQANELAQRLGLGRVTPLAVRTLEDFARLTERIEADETSLGDRITRAYSRHHHHLFLLGMHLGTEFARIEGSGGSLSLPPRAQIRRHATLTSIPAALWEPLAAAPAGKEPPAEVLARYRNGLTDLAANLSPGVPAK